jgi:peptidyl-prolyl cis-trans isomerase A (cyclophilin A)/peptidyl-prolyl cis-trans isomerase B (cyclophilin B)
MLAFTLSEVSTTFAAADVTISGGTLSGFSGSGTSYTATFTPATNSTANGVVSVSSGVFTDAAGNANNDGSDANNRVTISIDTVAPTISITDNVTGIATTATKAVAYSLSFSEPVTGLDSTGLTVTNGTISSIVGSGANWTVNVTPAQQVAGGAIGLTLKAGAVKDAAGNANALASNSSQTIDTAPPVAPKLIGSTSFNNVINPQITMQTSLGAVVLELYPGNAPATVANMLAYANSGFFDATAFHRVIPGFMVQGGGFNSALAYKTPTYGPITLESDNGLSNVRGTIAMARTSDPNSANTQFFINQVDNTFLNYANTASPGYAVFGKVISGLSVVDTIANVTTATYSTPLGTFQNVPVTEVVITSIRQTVAGSIYSNTATLSIGDLEAGAQWSFSLNGGLTWASGSGDKLTIPVGSYAVDAIQIRQADVAGNLSAGVGKLTSSLVVGSSAPPGKAILGTTGNDLIVGTTGNDTIDGGAGIDTMTFSGVKANYKVTQTGGAATVNSNADGSDSLINVERLKFTDGNLALDLGANQSSGQTVLLLGAILPGKLALDVSKQALLGSVIGLFDSGFTMADLSGALLRLDIWSILTGQSVKPASRTLAEDTVIVKYLLGNVYGLVPDDVTVRANADVMHSEAFQGAWLAQLALSNAGQNHIGLVGLANTGIAYG